jgi:hypothetical protein
MSLILIVRPTATAPPKSRAARPALIIATGCASGTRSSSVVSGRPADAPMPSVGK